MLPFSPRSVGEILSAMNLQVVDAIGSATAHVFTDDSREVVPGAVFIARSGVQPNIEPFITQALAAGAVLVITFPAFRCVGERRPHVHLKKQLSAPGLVLDHLCQIVERLQFVVL